MSRVGQGPQVIRMAKKKEDKEGGAAPAAAAAAAAGAAPAKAAAPAAGKKAAASADNGPAGDDAVVLDYLRKMNRPYSVNDLHSNMHGKIGKTALPKVLSNLVASNLITQKAYGKQVVFVVKQDNLEAPSQAELDKMDDEFNALKQELATLKAESKELAGEVAKLTSSMTVEQMQARLAQLQAENTRNAARLKTLRSGGNMISPADAKKINQSYEYNVKMWRSRKRKCKEILDMILENSPMKPKDLMEAIGVETDESVGVQLPSA